MPFDVDAARKAGYSDDDIIQHLTATRKFDVDGALRAGYAKPDIIAHLSSAPAAVAQEPSAVGRAAGAGWDALKQFNPIPMVTQDYETRQAIRQGSDAAFKQGDYLTGARKAVTSSVPLAGPMVDSMSDFAGKAWEEAKAAFQSGDTLTALRKVIEAAVPVAGQLADQPSNYAQEGKYPEAIGSTLGTAAGMYAGSKMTPENIKGAATTVAEKAGEAGKSTSRWIAKSALKPNKYVGNKAQINKAIDLELKEGYMPSTEGLGKLRSDKNATGRGIRTTYENGKGVVKGADIEAAVNSMKDDLLPSERAAVDAAVETDVLGPLRQADGSLRDMAPGEAFALKVKLQNAVRRANKQFYRSGIGTPGVEGKATSAGTIGDKLVEQFPEIKDQNARYSAISTLEDILDDAETRISKHEPIPLSGWVSGAAGAGAGFIHGGAGEAGLAAAGSAALAKVIGNPKLRLKVAIALSKASEGALSLAKANNRLKALKDLDLVKPPTAQGGGGEYMRPKGGLSEPIEGKTVFHGTPHEFDKFDMSKIGTGEGAQAYGHGLYFAENPGVARSYRNAGLDNTSGPMATEISLDGKPVPSTWKELVAEFPHKGPDGNPNNVHIRDALRELQRTAGDFDRSRQVLGSVNDKAFAKKSVEALDSLRGRVEVTKTRGSVLSVELPHSAIDNMLDWDKPLSEQPKAVQDLVAEASSKNPAFADDLERTVGGKRATPLGQTIYKRLADELERQNTDRYNPAYGDEMISKELRKRGIPGIRYLDQGSRGMNTNRWLVDSGGYVRDYGTKAEAEAAVAKRPGSKITPPSASYNYVLFDDETPKIIKPERLAEIEYEKTAPKAKVEPGKAKVSQWLLDKIAQRKASKPAPPAAVAAAPAINTPYQPDSGKLARDAQGRFISDKTRLSEFAKF